MLFFNIQKIVDYDFLGSNVKFMICITFVIKTH